MIHRPRLEDVGPTPAAPAPNPASIDTWLAFFVRMLRLPENQQQSIRDELGAHLHERVRDLMVAGSDEPNALRVAIDELGSAAELAQRLTNANRPAHRKLTMNTAIVGFAAISVVTAGFLVSAGNNGPEMAFYRPPAVSDQREALEGVSTTVEFQETPVSEVFEYFATVLESDMVVHWEVLSETGIEPEDLLSMKLEKGRPVNQILGIIRDQLGARSAEASLDWRFGDELVEFGTIDYFDAREIVLATYDVTEILELVRELHNYDHDTAIDRVKDLIHSYVEPNAWNANGGRLGQLTIVGTKMFVNAPKRYHIRIEWILAQLLADAPNAEMPNVER